MALPDPLLIGLCGPPRCGKSDYGIRLLLQYPPSYTIIVVDSNGDMPDRLHDGTRVPLVHTSPDRLRWRLRLGIDRLQRIMGEQERKIYRLRSARVAFALARSVASRAHPVVLYIDEAVHWRDCRTAGLSDELLDYCGDRRHRGLSIIYGCQYPRQIHYAMFSSASALVLWQIKDHDDLARLGSGGVDDEIIAQLPALRGPREKAHDHLVVPRLADAFDPLRLD